MRCNALRVCCVRATRLAVARVQQCCACAARNRMPRNALRGDPVSRGHITIVIHVRERSGKLEQPL